MAERVTARRRGRRTPQDALTALVLTAGNPAPDGGAVHRVVTADGLILRAAHWLPAAADVKGVVCILQGRSEFIEKYFEVVGELRQRGFHVVVFDWRGQGGSQRLLKAHRTLVIDKGYISDFAEYQHDLDAVLEQVVRPLGDLPCFALCHSMGGTIALLRAAMPGHEEDFARIVTTAPMIAISPALMPPGAAGIAHAGARMGLGRAFVPGGRRVAEPLKPFEGNRLTQDRARYLRTAAIVEHAPQLAIGSTTFGWLSAALRAIRTLAAPRFALSVATPVLVVAAGADSIVSTPATERFCARLKAGNAIVIPYARHEILMENDDIRAVFWAAFDEFVPGYGLGEGNLSQPSASKASAAS